MTDNVVLDTKVNTDVIEKKTRKRTRSTKKEDSDPSKKLKTEKSNKTDKNDKNDKNDRNDKDDKAEKSKTNLTPWFRHSRIGAYLKSLCEADKLDIDNSAIDSIDSFVHNVIYRAMFEAKNAAVHADQATEIRSRDIFFVPTFRYLLPEQLKARNERTRLSREAKKKAQE